jgi:uncharacterized protein (DUF983 family)
MPNEVQDPMQPTHVREARSVVQAMLRGAAERCPACGKGHMFRAYLKVANQCPACGEELHHHRADDAPPYFTIFIVAHIVVGGVLALEQAVAPPDWVHAIIWLPLTVVLSLLLLPRVKGSLVGLQWALRMHGFSGVEDTPIEDPAAAVAGSAGAMRGGER